MSTLSPKSFIETIKAVLPILKIEKAFPPNFEDSLSRIITEHDPVVDRERFNIIVSAAHLPPAKPEFFSFYFNGLISTTQDLRLGLEKFIKDAIWHFGDLRHGYFVLNGMASIQDYISQHQFDVSEFHQRRPLHMIDEISPDQRGYLGYVSGQRPIREDKIWGEIEKILDHVEKNKKEYSGLNPAELSYSVTSKLTADLTEKISSLDAESQEKGLELFNFAELSKNRQKVTEIRQKVRATISMVENLKKIGERNQLSYLRNVEMIDVYVATSMRTDEEYNDMCAFVNKVFADELVKPLNLRYFDPTLCYCPSRIDKGIIECLLVRCAKVTIYCAQEGDTFGKDSELAATLCQGKPVIVYVPTGSDKLDSRAKTFKDFHPLGLQVGLTDGVARGVIVVRSPEECATMLHRILTNTIEIKITFEDNGIVLREAETNSVLRVMTGWRELASSFWHNFGLSDDSKQGRPS